MDEQHLRIRATISEIATASDFVLAAARRAGLDDQQCHHCQLAVDEVCTNIVEHGFGTEDHSQAIDVAVQALTDRFVIRISDRGRRFDPLKRPDPDPNTPLEERGTGGWGIFFVKKVMDDVNYEYLNGRNQLTMIKLLKKAAPDGEDQAVVVNAHPSGLWLVTVKGRLDQTIIPRLEAALSRLLDAGHKHLLLDMTRVEGVSSRALKMLVSQWKRARDMRGDLMLVGLSLRVREMFSMIGFDLVFNIFTSIDEAVSAFKTRK